MTTHDVTVFRPYPFKVGQKIRIEGTRRQGDWQVTAVSENTVTLRCPVSFKEFEWPVFCYRFDDEKGVVWPQE